MNISNSLKCHVDFGAEVLADLQLANVVSLTVTGSDVLTDASHLLHYIGDSWLAAARSGNQIHGS